MHRCNQVMPVDSSLVSDPKEAVQRFESHGGHLTLFSPFGQDPLKGRDDLMRANNEEIYEKYPDFARFFSSVANNDYTLFREGLLFLLMLVDVWNVNSNCSALLLTFEIKHVQISMNDNTGDPCC